MKQVGTLKKEILVSLDNIPPEGLREVQTFLDYIRYKFQKKPVKPSPFIPVALGGLWEGENIGDQDIDDIRKEMWQGLESRQI